MYGRLEQGCGTISDAYIHYYYKLQAKLQVKSVERWHWATEEPVRC